MKKNYLKPADMARAVSAKYGISFQDAKSRISRKKLKKQGTTVSIKGQEHELFYFSLPDEWKD